MNVLVYLPSGVHQYIICTPVLAYTYMILRKNKNSDIKMNFKLLEAQYPSLNRDEQIILVSCLSQINPKKMAADTPITLIANDFKDLASSGKTNRYRDLKSAVDKLYDRTLIIDNPDPDNPELSYTRTRWVHAIDYYEKLGKVVLYFAPKLIPYIADLEGGYRSFEKLQVSNFKSKHTFKLYKLLIQWQGKGHRELTLVDIRKIFDLGKSYDRTAELKRKVIDPAVKDINDHTNLWVGTKAERKKNLYYSQRKNGRSVVALQFTFGFKDEVDAPKNIISIDEFVRLNPELTHGKSEDEVREMMKVHKEKVVDESQHDLFS